MSTAGEYVRILTLVDVYSGWTENRALLNSAQRWTKEGEEARQALAELYENYNRLVNYFFPSMRIISKEREDAKVVKKYDSAKTPFRRLLESDHIDEETKNRLKQTKETLDLDTLLENTRWLQEKLLSMAVPWN